MAEIPLKRRKFSIQPTNQHGSAVLRALDCRSDDPRVSILHRGWALLYPANEVCVYVGIILSVRLSVHLSAQSLLNLGYNFWTKSDRAFIFNTHMSVPNLVTLTSTFVLLKKKNLGHNFRTERDRVFIIGMGIPYGKTFLSVLKFLIPWPWPPNLTYFWRKKLNLCIKFWTKRDCAFTLRMDISCGKTFLSISIFYPVTLTSDLSKFCQKHFTMALPFEQKRDSKRLKKLGREVLWQPVLVLSLFHVRMEYGLSCQWPCDPHRDLYAKNSQFWTLLPPGDISVSQTHPFYCPVCLSLCDCRHSVAKKL